MLTKKVRTSMIKKPYPFLLSDLSCIAKTSQANIPTKVIK